MREKNVARVKLNDNIFFFFIKSVFFFSPVDSGAKLCIWRQFLGHPEDTRIPPEAFLKVILIYSGILRNFCIREIIFFFPQTEYISGVYE